MNETERQIVAEFSQSRNDMYWKIYDLEDGYIRWAGYDDDFWWHNISVKPDWQTRTGQKSGKQYRLNPISGDVFITSGEHRQHSPAKDD